jgi:hypothetical protein
MHPPPQLFGSVPRPGRAGNASKKVLAQQFCAERANSALGEDLQKRKLCRFAPLNRKVINCRWVEGIGRESKMGPRFIFAALTLAFSLSLVFATLTTKRQVNAPVSSVRSIAHG